MRKLLYLILIFIFILGILGLAIFNLENLANSNKQIILNQIEKQIDRKVSIDDIGISIFRGLGLKLLGFTIKDDPNYSSGDFVRAKSLVISVELLPLFKKKLRIKKAILVDPEITLIQDKNKKFNFSTLGSKNKDTKESTSKGDEAQKEFSVSLVDISSGVIYYKSLLDSTDIKISDIDLRSRNIGFKKPVDFDLAFAILNTRQNIKLKGKAGPLGINPDFNEIPLESEVAIDSLSIKELKRKIPAIRDLVPDYIDIINQITTNFSISGKLSKFNINNFQLESAVLGSDEPNLLVRNGNIGPLGSGSNTSMDLDFELSVEDSEQITEINLLKKSLPDNILLSGPVYTKGLISGTFDNLNLNSLFADLSSAKFVFKDIVDKSETVPFKLTSNATFSGNSIKLENTALELNKLIINADGYIGTGENKIIDLGLKSNEAELSSLSENIIALGDFKTSGNIEIDAKIKGSYEEGSAPGITGNLKLINAGAQISQLPEPISGMNGLVKFTGEKANVDNAKLFIGDSPMILNADIRSFSPLTVSYKLNSEKVNLQDIMATAKEGEVLKDVVITGNFSNAGGKNSNRMDIKSQSGKYSKLNYNNLAGKVSLTGDVVDIDSLKLDILGSTLNSKGQYILDDKSPRFDISTNISAVNLTEIIKSFISPDSDHITGNTSLSLDISGEGKEWGSISKTLNGLGQLKLTEGKLTDFNFADELLRGITGVKGLSDLLSADIKNKYPTIFKSGTTNFYSIDTPLKIKDGKINMSNILLAATEYVVKGDGYLGLDSGIDMKGILTLSENLSGDLNSKNKYLKYLVNKDNKIELPFKLKGKFPSVRPQPDVDFISRKISAAIIDDGKSKIKDKILDEIAPKKKNNENTSEDTETPVKKEPKNPVEGLIEEGIKGIFN